MEFFEVIEQRYSVRAYTPDPVEEGKLHRVLDAARLAPTAVNFQPFQIIVIHTAGRQDELKRIYSPSWFTQAPIVLALCAVPAQGWVRKIDGRNYTDVDVAIVMDHLVLAATAQGLGTCWIGAFNPTAAREILGLPEGVEPITFTPLGYPADHRVEKNRKPLESLVHYERW